MAHLPLGVGPLQVTAVGGILHFGTVPQREASLEAGGGHFREIGEKKGLCLCERNCKTSDPALDLPWQI